MVKVAKFGGSSLSNAAQVRKVRDIVLGGGDYAAVVVSAPGKDAAHDKKVTDLLYRCCGAADDVEIFERTFAEVRQRYLAIRDELGLMLDLEGEFDAIRSRCARDFSREYLVSRGEYLMARLAAAALGYAFVDSADWLCFDFNKAVDVRLSGKRLREAVQKHGRVVTPGFYGVLPDGAIHLFPRGGSDLTGAYAAAGLHADCYENWTDVPGILMADPTIVQDPKPIPYLNYDELRKLSYMGAVVVHADTVFPLIGGNIPLHIRNTNDPAAPGTVITGSALPACSGQSFLTGISGRRNYTVISVYKSVMCGLSRDVLRALEVCDRRGINVEHLPKGIDSFSLVIGTEQLGGRLGELLADLKAQCAPDLIDVAEHLSLIAAVGKRMAGSPGIAGQLFSALGERGISIRLIEQDTDENCVVLGVADEDFAPAVRVLYDRFIGR